MGAMSGWAYHWRLRLPSPLTRTVIGICPPFHNHWLTITPKNDCTIDLRLEAGWQWNGVSVAPDAPGTHDATAIHDCCYRYLKAIAAAWGMTEQAVRKILDDWFLQIMQQDACPVADLYYDVVRRVGGIYQWLQFTVFRNRFLR